MKLLVHQTYTRNKFPFDIFARAILLFQGMYRWDKSKRYSHYVMQFGDIVTDASPFGVRVNGSDYFHKNNKIVKTFEIYIPCTEKEFFDWVKPHLGKGYGFKQILGMAGRLTGLIKNNPWGKGAGRIICNELVLLMLKDWCGAPVGNTDNYDLLDTEKVLRACLGKSQEK